MNPETKAKIMDYLTETPRCFVEEIVEGTGVARHITPLSAPHNAVRSGGRGYVKHCKTPPQ